MKQAGVLFYELAKAVMIWVIRTQDIQIQALPSSEEAVQIGQRMLGARYKLLCNPKQKLGALGVQRLIQSHEEISQAAGLLFDAVSFVISTGGFFDGGKLL